MQRNGFLSVLGRSLAAAGVIGLAGCDVYVGPRRGYVVYSQPQPVYVQQPAPQPVYVAGGAAQPGDEAQLQQLVAPIALYPDPLLAQVLAASTYPAQVQQAGAWLAANPSPSEAAIDAQPWDPSIKAMVHYPTVLQYLNSNMAWTQSLGAAFAARSADVMAAVQDMRAQAVAVGNLRTDSQVVIVQDAGVVYVQPADPDVIYVPAYDPALVYVSACPITFGVGFRAGVWLGLGFDWSDHIFFVGDWRAGWVHGAYGWRRDPYFHHDFHAWGHDARWGPAPHVMAGHYAVHGDFHGRAFHPAPIRHSAGRGYGAHPEPHGGGGHDEHR